MSSLITYYIKAYRIVNISITTPTSSRRNITLYKFTLVPSFFTNLVSFNKVIKKGIY